MLNQFLFIFMVILSTWSEANAADIETCNLQECLELRVQLDARIHKLQSEIAHEFGEVVHANEGSKRYCAKVGDSGICFMSQKNATEYCASQGQHLPSVRELALLSASFGARGILEGASSDSYEIKAKNVDNAVDKFYFSNAEYRRPSGELGNIWYWSSSVRWNSSNFGYYLSGITGYIDYVIRFDSGAVRCVAGP